MTTIYAEDYGRVRQLTIKQNGVVQDISSFTTLEIIFVNPSGTAVAKTAEFATDGTDGVIQYTILDGDMDTSGAWKVFGRVAKTGSEITTSYVDVVVLSRLD